MSSSNRALPVRVLTRDQHGISRKQLSPAAMRVLYGLKDAGFDAFLVGGAVRDLLIGQAPKDFDIATNATPDEVYKIFRNCRLVGRRFVIAHVVFGREVIEVTTFRGAEGAGERHVEEGGRIVRDNVFGSIEEDAARRDFRANALYYNIADFSVLDFVGGLQDLITRELHLIGDTETRFREDPVRMLRAARLKAKLDFRLAPEIEESIAQLHGLLAEIPPARLFDEVQKLLMSGHALASWAELLRLGLLEALFPAMRSAVIKRSNTFLQAALGNTDARLAMGKSVTPAFLFAALGWALMTHRLAEKGQEISKLNFDERDALFDAAVRDTAERVALPRRFSLQVRDIWELQQRLTDTTPSRARKLVSNPRFRAGYDFLLLRAYADERLHACAQRWTDAQEPDASFEAIFGAHRSANAAEMDFDPVGADKRRRRSRGGRGRKSFSDSVAPVSTGE
jgi:poly(A) polymerase